MIEILLSWIWIGISSFLWGMAFYEVIKRVTNYDQKSLDMTIVMGLCFLTVYAEMFSLFYKVGMVATVGVLICNILILVCLRKDIINMFQTYWDKCLRNKRALIYVTVFLVILVLILAVSASTINHYDTYLYHAQAIRWIEEYGIVPGLGNLHNRLAYNSSFFSVQALFSLKFLTGRSLHSLNGFVSLVLISYGVFSIKAFRKRKVFVSDFLRMALLYYLMSYETLHVLSSPGSDVLSLGLISYISVKWIDLEENKEHDITPYAVLCLLGVYALTVKLSAAMIILLVIKPAFLLIKQKRWKEICFYLLTGSVIIIPFLIRNIIISGYLIYPYSSIDLFSVDWKMSKQLVDIDRNEIKAWGRGLNDVQRHTAPFSEWFPIWFATLGKFREILLFLTVIVFLPSIVWSLWTGLKKNNWDSMLFVGTQVGCLMLWFWGSPLPRYGSIFLMILPMFFMGYIVRFIDKHMIGGAMGFANIGCCLLADLHGNVNKIRAG